MDNGDEFMTEKRVADILRVSPSTMAAWRYRGVGPPYQKIGRTIRYKAADLSKFLDECTVHTDSFNKEA